MKRYTVFGDVAEHKDGDYVSYEDVEYLRKRVAELEAARMAYASEFEYDLDKDGMPNVGNIHQNIRKLKMAYVHAAIDAERAQVMEEAIRTVLGSTLDGWQRKILEAAFWEKK